MSFFINFEEKLIDLLNSTLKENNSDQLRLFLTKELPNISLKKNFNYIRLYYEKALQYNPDDEDIWNDFIQQAQIKDFKVSHKTYLNILVRSCKCCYFKVNFWIILLREMEKQGCDQSEIESKN